MDIDNYSEDDVNRILSLCYNYGLTTFGYDYHSMCISNNLISISFWNAKETSPTKTLSHTLTEFLRNPTNSNSLKKALKLILKLETLRDNSFSEELWESASTCDRILFQEVMFLLLLKFLREWETQSNFIYFFQASESAFHLLDFKFCVLFL